MREIIMYEGQATDYDAANRLAGKAPRAFKKATDLLVATKRYLSKAGIFSTERSRIRRVQSEIYALSGALKADGFSQCDEQADNIFAFMNEVSAIFPNWREEYRNLNSLIPLCF